MIYASYRHDAGRGIRCAYPIHHRPGFLFRVTDAGMSGTSGTRGNLLGNMGYLDLLRIVKCEFAEVLLREEDATTIAADPLYIASGETTFKPPAGPYLLEE